MSFEGKIIHLEKQDDFTVCDLTDANTEMFGSYFLIHEPGLAERTSELAPHQRALFDQARSALSLRDVNIDNAPAEYEAFLRGFASIEFIKFALAGMYDYATATRNVRILYMEPGVFVDYDLSERSKTWPQDRPNIYTAVTMAGASMGETMNQLQARAIGAQIAAESIGCII